MMTDPQMPEFLYWIMVILGGLALGSFTTCATYRIPRGLSIWRQEDGSYRSFCPSCKAPLSGRDLIPVLSWLIQGGKCRYCKAPIGSQYLLIELAVLLSVVVLALIFKFSPWFFILSFSVPIIAVAIACLKHNK